MLEREKLLNAVMVMETKMFILRPAESHSTNVKL